MADEEGIDIAAHGGMARQYLATYIGRLFEVSANVVEKRKTSATAASKAGRVLNDPKASAAAKSAAASALIQRATRDYGRRKSRGR